MTQCFLPYQAENVPKDEKRKIMCAGDSICAGNQSTGTCGWRYRFFQKFLAGFGYTPRFVGTDFNGSSNCGLPTCGQSGWKAADLLTSVNAQSPVFTPDVVLMMIGINNVLAGDPDATTISTIGQILDKLRLDNPNVTVIVASLIDRDTYTSQVVAFNSALLAYLQTRSDYGSTVGKVNWYDMYTAFGAYSASTYADQTHPNPAGYRTMGTLWFTAYYALFP